MPGALDVVVVLPVRGQPFVAPRHVRIQLAPLHLGSLQRHPGQSVEFVAGVFKDVVQRRAQRLDACGHCHAELQQLAADNYLERSSG